MGVFKGNSRLKPSLGEVLLAVAAAMATTTLVTAIAAAATLHNERRPA
ncbi:hypothetical protein [Nonomuraea sp. NPDC049646]